MNLMGFTLADAKLEKSPGQDAEIFVGDLVDQSNGGAITVGYGRYGADQSLSEVMVVDDVMIVLEGALTVSADEVVVEAKAGSIVYMPKGRRVTIRAHGEGAVTAYVTHPHWQPAHD